uniref:LIM zinc-binding domain-containing protein n=1 Tax=Strigamia maritima TaxID=126957 RepID=T1J1G8_STRMM
MNGRARNELATLVYQQTSVLKRVYCEGRLITSVGISVRGVLVQEVDEDRPCLSCRDRCPGFKAHVWRKVCSNCKCPREAHDVYHEEFVNVRERIGFKCHPDPNRRPSKERSRQEGYSWIPPGLDSDKVIEEYFNQLPNHKVPRLESPGEKYRNVQLMVQLPKQDLALAYCQHVDPDYQTNFEDFVNARNEIALDIGYVRDRIAATSECHKCRGILQAGDLAVVAPKFGENVGWHPACFVCTTCDELLVDLTYCVNDGLVYCERHYAETLKPRCAACDEVDLAFFSLSRHFESKFKTSILGNAMVFGFFRSVPPHPAPPRVLREKESQRERESKSLLTLSSGHFLQLSASASSTSDNTSSLLFSSLLFSSLSRFCTATASALRLRLRLRFLFRSGHDSLESWKVGKFESLKL